jgi:hypothetical protein
MARLTEQKIMTGETLDYEIARPVRRSRGIRFRVIVAFGLIALACVAMAYATGKQPMVEGPSELARSQGIECWAKPGDPVRSPDADLPKPQGHCWVPVHVWVQSTGPAEPNFFWFLLAFYASIPAAATAFLSFLATGRPW